jgi:8-oxo-dGTP pyrophosphatase MutT (NUDIX family)
VYETPWIKVYRDEVLNQNEKPLTYSYLRSVHPPVTIIAVDPRGCILLQKNYRHTISQTLWEVPAGNSEGQDPLEAAKRELLEESGLVSDEWSSLGEAQLAAGVADIHHYIYLAKNVRLTTDERDEDEDISEQSFFSKEKVRRMILDDKIIDGDTLIGLYRYMLENDRKEK